MRIAQLAPTYERVPPVMYGGTELIVQLLTDELVRRGHDVTLFATGDSITSARLRAITPGAVRYAVTGPLQHAEYVQLANVQACFREAAEGAFDIVHNHAGVEGLVLAATAQTPVLTTNHNAYVPETAPIWDAYPWRHVELSAASARTFPIRGALEPVHNGIDVATFPFREEAEGDVLFLGRFSPEKGPDRAIEAARRAGRRLLLAGKVDSYDVEYFQTKVAPHIDGDGVRYIGEVDATEKRELLGRAPAVLFPIDWDEPFGLVMIEALACGTPVIALGYGSVPEVLEHGETGFIVDDVDGMVEALRQIGTLSRYRCRRAAEQRFDVGRMADEYERRYAETIVAGPLPTEAALLVR